MTSEWMRQYEAQRAALAASHDDGANDALRDSIRDNAEVDCSSYCYGGSPSVDIGEVLADLAEAGWRLVRPTAASSEER